MPTKLQMLRLCGYSSKLGSKDGLEQETPYSRCFIRILAETTSDFPGFDPLGICGQKTFILKDSRLNRACIQR